MKTKGARTNARTNARAKGEDANLKRWLSIFDRQSAAAVVRTLLDPERRPTHEVIAFMERHRAYPAVILDSPAANPRFQVVAGTQY